MNNLLKEARAVAKKRANQTGEAVYLYRSVNSYTIRDFARGPLDTQTHELIEIIGQVPS